MIISTKFNKVKYFNNIDRLKAIKKANASKRHDYYYMYDKYNYLNKLMLTFTYNDDNKYFKMQVVNEIKNYITKLIRNTKNSNIKYYANIELGEYYDNPHLHIQFFYDDLKQIMSIRDKVISKFGLFSEYCCISIPERANLKYEYVIKDYSNKVKDEDLLLLDSVKKDYRNFLGKNLRFTSFSKEKYTKATYKRAYSHGIKKANVDILLDNFIINKDLQIIDSKVIRIVKILLLIQYLEQVERLRFIDCILDIKKATYQLKILIYCWIYGFT